MSVPIKTMPAGQFLTEPSRIISGPFHRWLQDILVELHRALCPPKTIVSCYLSADDISANFDGTGLGLKSGPYQWWAICNGSNGTPDLNASFLRGSSTAAGGTGGSATTSVPSGTTTVAGGGVPVASLTHTHTALPPYHEVVYLMRVAEST